MGRSRYSPSSSRRKKDEEEIPKKDGTLANGSWGDAFASIAPGLGKISGQVADMDNPLNQALQLLIESDLVGKFAKHMKNRRDLKAAAQYTAENPINPEKGFMTEWNTDMGIKDTAKVIPGSNQANVDTFFQGTKQANYTGNTNLVGNLPDINPKINPQLTAAVTPGAGADIGAKAGAGLSGAQIGAALAVASLVLGNKKKEFSRIEQPKLNLDPGTGTDTDTGFIAEITRPQEEKDPKSRWQWPSYHA